MNGRYYAGKQLMCEFVNISRWKMAICGEYMKSRLKTCSHGTACNFIHCFHNPGGDYEWADWDNPPPRYWLKKMAVLFGPSDEPRHEIDGELENRQLPRESSKKMVQKSDRYHSRGARYSEIGLSCSSGGDDSDGSRERSERGDRYRSQRRRPYSWGRMTIDFADKWDRFPENHFPEVDDYCDYSRYSCDSDDDMSRAKKRGSSRWEGKDKERRRTEDHEKHARKHKSDSSNRSRGKIAADVEEKLETTAKCHGQEKRHELLDSDDGNRKVNDGHQRDCRSSNKADYKYVSTVGEEYSHRSRSVNLYSERPHKRKECSDHFDQSNECSRSKHRSHNQKRHRGNKFREQAASGEDFTPIYDRRIGATDPSKVHDKFVTKRKRRSHRRNELTDSGSLETSEESSYDKHFTARRKRHHKKREHLVVEEGNGGSGSGSM